MLFMDYRTDYVDKADLSAEEAKGLDETPTFLYAMPMGTAPNGRKKIFFEEVRVLNNVLRVRSRRNQETSEVIDRCLNGTVQAYPNYSINLSSGVVAPLPVGLRCPQTSLVARPPISFDLCKERLYRRLKHHGIEVTKVEDEEFCYIPMGGAMPNLTQVRGVQSMKPRMSHHVMPCLISCHASLHVQAWFGADHVHGIWAASPRLCLLLSCLFMLAYPVLEC